MRAAGKLMIEQQGSTQVTGDLSRDAAIVFARAMEEYARGRFEVAIELLARVISLCESDERLAQDTTCVAAHINLYKAHRALGRYVQAAGHFNKAVSLGANADRLRKY
jgi:tetratricopeptide (TPR) repeat protein